MNYRYYHSALLVFYSCSFIRRHRFSAVLYISNTDPSSCGPSESNDTGALDVFDFESLEHCDSEFESYEDMHPEPVSSDSESDFCFDDEVRLCNI